MMISRQQLGFVTIRIFARTEPNHEYYLYTVSFVTIRIFARTEPNLQKC